MHSTLIRFLMEVPNHFLHDHLAKKQPLHTLIYRTPYDQHMNFLVRKSSRGKILISV